jgi:hypothetical protein
VATASSIAPLPGSDNQTTRPFTVFRTVGVVLKDNAGRPIPGVNGSLHDRRRPRCGLCPSRRVRALRRYPTRTVWRQSITLIAGGPATVRPARQRGVAGPQHASSRLTIAGKGPSYPEDHAGRAADRAGEHRIPGPHPGEDPGRAWWLARGREPSAA